MNFHSPAIQADLRTYNASMEKSLEDKLFFLEHTAGAMTFVDFGCANGAVLKAVSDARERKTLIGIDNQPMQLVAAASRLPNAVLVPSFDHALPLIRESEGPRVAIFSSVIHEAPTIAREPVESGLFDYIVVRDMGIVSSLETTDTPQQWLDRVTMSDAHEVWKREGRSLGRLDEFTEFLLKAPYLGHTPVQTQRELDEAYPIRGIQEVLDRVPGYAVSHFEHYSAPWVVDRIRHEFGFEFPYPTHFKMILRKVTP